jgi:hypothetical protein
MLYGLIADAIVVLHLAFIAFALLGVIAVNYWPRLIWVHIPVVVWSALINLTQTVCPLTPLEISMRRKAGEQGYGESFIEHYLVSLVYPPLDVPQLWLWTGLFVVGLNGAGYAWLVQRRHRP